jgi:hypothetical protein
MKRAWVELWNLFFETRKPKVDVYEVLFSNCEDFDLISH